MAQQDSNSVSPLSLSQKLRSAGYKRPEDASRRTLEEFLSTCRLTLSELDALRAYLADAGRSFRPGVVRYPFVNPLLQAEVAAAGIDLSRTSITTAGLPTWAEAPLLAGGMETLDELVGASTFYVRAVLGYGGRPQSILRHSVEEHLLGLLRSARQPDQEPTDQSNTSLRQLPISPRTRNALRRAGVFTVEQLQRMTDSELGRLRGLGEKGRSEILSLLPSSTPADAAPDALLQAETVSVRPDVARRPVSDLDIPAPLADRLKASGITTIGALVRDLDTRLGSIPRIGKQSERRIRGALERYLLSKLEDVGHNVPEIVAEVQAEAASTTIETRLKELIRQLGNRRAERLLTMRFGLDGPVATLEKAGEEFGITRERVRQLERAALNRLVREYPAEVESLTRPAYEALAAVGGVAPLSYLLQQLPTLYRTEQAHVAGAARLLLELAPGSRILPGRLCALREAVPSDVASFDDAMVTTLRKRMQPLAVSDLTVAIAGTSCYPAVLERYASFSLAARARANPLTTVLASGMVALREWDRNRLDNAYQALRSLGKPSHYKLIATRLQEALPEGSSVSVEAVHNLLLSEAAFTRAGRGVFGLAEWQTGESDITQQIAALLEASERPLHRSEIARQLSLQERVVERELITRPEFDPEGRGYYSLAGHEYSPARSGERRPRATVLEVGRGADGLEYVRVRVSPATHRSGTLALNSRLLPLFPTEGRLDAAWPASRRIGQKHHLHRGRSHISGLKGFFHSEGVSPGDSIYIQVQDIDRPCYYLYTEDQWRATASSNLLSEGSGTSSDS